MGKVKRSLLQKGGSDISSCAVIEVSSADGKLKLIDLINSKGVLRGTCWFEAGDVYDWDVTDYLYEALLDLKNKDKSTNAYRVLKNYIKEGGLVFKNYKQELKVMFNDAVKLGMFSSVPKSVKIEQDKY